MKKRNLLAIFAALAMTATMFAVGCNEGGGTGSGTGDNNPPPPPPPPAEDTSTKLSGKIYLVGDSTVCDYRPKLDDYFLPRYGYGTMLYNYINCEENQIVNLAISGRSSKSFYSESNYTTLQNSISAGDYLIIGFGHNDEKSDDSARYTDAKGKYNEATTSNGDSFQYVLNEKYVKLAKEKGATPILCTPIVRYDKEGTYANAVIHNTTTSDKSGKGGDYVAAIKALGTATNTTVVDLTSLTKAVYEADNAKAAYFHAHTTHKGAAGVDTTGTEEPDGIDTTHINMYGAKMVSYQLAKALLGTDNALKAHVITNSTAPTFETDYLGAVKMDYKKPVYNGFTPSEHAGSKVDTIGGADWYHTAMGILGGNKAGSYTFTKSNDKYIIGADAGSKFAATQDGFGAIFTQIDVSKNFTISAKVKVTGKPSSVNDQNAFGIMLRDDIYIDENIGTITSNFCSASVTGAGKANMCRMSKTELEYDGTIPFTMDAEYEITLERLGQVITATVKQGSNTRTTLFNDISYVGIDNSHIYLCLFANRGLTVEFSEVNFSLTGNSQGE